MERKKYRNRSPGEAWGSRGNAGDTFVEMTPRTFKMAQEGERVVWRETTGDRWEVGALRLAAPRTLDKA